MKIFALDFHEYIFFSRKFCENMCKTEANALKSLTDLQKLHSFRENRKNLVIFELFSREQKGLYDCSEICAKFRPNTRNLAKIRISTKMKKDFRFNATWNRPKK